MVILYPLLILAMAVCYVFVTVAVMNINQIRSNVRITIPARNMTILRFRITWLTVEAGWGGSTSEPLGKIKPLRRREMAAE